MNPFLDSTVAVPTASEPALLQPPRQAERLNGRWSFPFAPQTSNRLARRSRVAVMLAGVGVGLSAQALDLNTATAEQLTDLRGVGPRTAQIIVQERNRAGPFESLEDLSDRVRGIGLKRLQTLQAAGLRVSKAGAAAQAAPRRVALPTSVATPTIESVPSQ
jgi:competence protein ComEA